MHTQAGSLISLADASPTDVILALCASGHFGVREAIAAATRQEPRQMGQNPSTVQVETSLYRACDVFLQKDDPRHEPRINWQHIRVTEVDKKKRL